VGLKKGWLVVMLSTIRAPLPLTRRAATAEGAVLQPAANFTAKEQMHSPKSLLEKSPTS
jgi:hypothetical protein